MYKRFNRSASQACLDYSVNGYDDWFLPSEEELNLMYKYLHLNSIGRFADFLYMSSSNGGYSGWAIGKDFSSGDQGVYGDYGHYVRPIRAF